MIKEVTYYDIICDSCGKSLTKESEMCYTDTESAEMVAIDTEWKKISGKHYCADCYELDEKTEEYVPKKGGEKMKKYIVKFKDREKVFGEFSSKEEASDKVMEYINGHYISPFDFVLEEVECKEVNEVITDYESAKKYLVGKTNDVFGVAKKLSKSTDPPKDAEILIKELNPKHIEALVSLNRLFTIAEAWNKAEGFVPDFSDFDQEKWFPWFNYDNDASRFVYTATNFAPANVGAPFGNLLCFKTSERAAQFGKQFEELYNKVFL